MTDIQLVAIDLDGTLLDDNRNIPPETLAVIGEVASKGVIVTLASGRAFCSVTPYASQLGINVPIISCCGAYVSDLAGKQLFVNHTLDWEHCRELVCYFEERGYYIKVYYHDRFYVQEVSAETETFSRNTRIPYHVLGKGRLTELTEPPLKMVFIDEASRIMEAYRELDRWSEYINKAQDSDTGIEIVAAHVSKASGLAELCGKYGIALENVMAIGNEGNDIEMLQAVGLGVAMGNACAQVKRHARAVTKSNTERGVEHALLKYVLHK